MEISEELDVMSYDDRKELLIELLSDEELLDDDDVREYLKNIFKTL